MYVDRKAGRVLLRNGVSMVDSFSLARKILGGEEITQKVMSDFHSQTYDFLNDTSISEEVQDIKPTPTETHQHTQDDITALMDVLVSSHRFDGSDAMLERIGEEIEFFERTNNIIFIFQCVDLIEKFKESGILWGVGRGSSCASLVFYLLEITDVNPLLYNIKFHELSKEM